MSVRCWFCRENITLDGEPDFKPTATYYKCDRCGIIQLTREAAAFLEGNEFSVDEKRIVGQMLRKDWERRNKTLLKDKLHSDDLKKLLSLYVQLDPIEKLDNALEVFAERSIHIGSVVNINITVDYPLFDCPSPKELTSICKLLYYENYIIAQDKLNPHVKFRLTAKAYQRIKKLQQPNKLSTQCFVAMWFNSEMNDVFEKAIKPAIEFKEKGAKESRFEAVKIDNVEHVNDINDEIIAQIRRSRFMVCDLTGYRGGVYFEAGFAYGLGLDVIYTCRKDWTKEEILKDNGGKDIQSLFDSNGREIPIKKEGVHFDLAHRNRIEWTIDNLDDFKKRLENRIKAVIY